MTEPTAGPIDDLGVVDPLRIPPVLGRAVRRLPVFGWLFVALAIVHVALEVPGRDVSSPLTVVGLIGRALVVLLPAVVLWRRPDAFAVTPGIVIGAILVAAGELGPVLVRSLDAWLPASAEPELPPLVDLPRLVIGVVLIAARAVGWLSIAVWVAELRPDPARTAAVVGARVVAAAAVLATVVSLVALYLDVTPADAVGFDAGSLALAVLFAVATIVWAYVAWVLVRQAGLRPRAATNLAAAAVVLLVLAELVEAATSLLLVATRSAELQDLSIASFQATSYGFLAAMVALVAAFALGVGDPPSEPTASPAERTAT
jgi:hypothetical protein